MKEIKELSKEDICYIAGVMDGEGCIMLSKTHRDDKRTPSYILRVRIKMTHKGIVMWLHATIGGKFYEEKRGHKKEQYEWSCCGRNAVEFLKQVYPYLKVKRLQAEIAFKYGETLRFGYHTRPPLSDDTITLRDKLRSEIVLLNSGRIINGSN